MAKKKLNLGFKIIQDGKTSCFFAFLYLVFFIVDTFITKGKLGDFFVSPTAQGGDLPFAASDFMSYARILLYPFGSGSKDADLFMISGALICLFGPAMEDRYGSVIIAVMMVVSAVFTGVLTACFCKHSAYGPLSIIYMMMFFDNQRHYDEKQIVDIDLKGLI
ncbi:MAG: hypothetical protein HUJ53_10825 [Holdemanella sp.]|nr:hypothetical protein [Holdemanella sp.]